MDQTLAPCAPGLDLRNHPDFDPILTANEAADYLKMHPKTLRHKAHGGEISFVRHGGPGCALKFRLSDLNRFTRQNLSKAAR